MPKKSDQKVEKKYETRMLFFGKIGLNEKQKHFEKKFEKKTFIITNSAIKHFLQKLVEKREESCYLLGFFLLTIEQRKVEIEKSYL